MPEIKKFKTEIVERIKVALFNPAGERFVLSREFRQLALDWLTEKPEVNRQKLYFVSFTSSIDARRPSEWDIFNTITNCHPFLWEKARSRGAPVRIIAWQEITEEEAKIRIGESE